jgi:protocatechuate 3,4-dioxygenase beta subunit
MLVRSLRGLVVLLFGSAISLPAEPSVVGTVFGPSGQPVVGAHVELVPVRSNFEAGRLRLAGQRDPGAVAEGRSDSVGRFLLRAPAAGVFKVVVRAEGRLPMQYWPLPLVEDEELPPVSLCPAARAEVIVRDPVGRPVAGAWVFLTSHDEGRAGTWRPDARIGQTGSDGSISLPRLEKERLDVSVFPPGGAELRQVNREGGRITVTAGAGGFRRLRVVSRGGPVAGVLVRIGDVAWPAGLTDAEGRLGIPCASGETGRIRLIAPDGRQHTADLPAGAAGSEMVVALANPVVMSGRVTDQETGHPLAGALISPDLDPGSFVLANADGRYRLVAPDSLGFTLQVKAARRLPRSARVNSTHFRAGRAPTLALHRATVLRGLVVDARGTPLAGIDVFAFPDPGGEPGFPESSLEAAVDHGATDGSGRFELRPLRTGNSYEIRAVRPGFLPVSTRALALARNAPPLKIVLSSARAARGRVQDAAGRPVAGVEVRLTPARAPGARRSPGEREEAAGEGSPFVARTDAQGVFLVTWIPAERVDLTARQRGYATGQIRGIRISPGAEPADLGTVTLKPGAPLKGRVIDRAGKPLTGAEAYLVESVDRLEQENARLKGETPDAVSGSDGSFTLEDLPQATPLYLLVRASGHLPAGVRGIHIPIRKPLSVRLEPAATLNGRVLDEQGAPVAGARVVLTWQPAAPENPERPAGAPVERSAVADPEGHFDIRDAPAGPVRLAVSARGYLSLEGFQTVVPQSDPIQELTLTLGKGAVLAGRISTTAGQPVSGARISAEGASEMSDDEGAYIVEGVPPGRVDVQVFHPAYKLFQREMVIQPGVNPLDVTFEEGVEVSGRVTDAQGAPVVGARVALLRQVLRDWREYRESTGEDGVFHFPAVARGGYRLHAGAEGYATTEVKRQIVVEEPLEGLEVVLQRGGTITGRILGLDPDQIPRLKVEACLDGGEPILALVDADGHYEIRHLRPGDYLVQASLESGERHVQARVPLPPRDEEVIRDLEFAPRLALSGQVLYDEEPLPEANISIRGSRLAVERSIRTDYEGRFRFEDLEPDTYWLGLSHSRELLVHNDTIDLAADREITVRVRPSTVSGSVLDARSRRPIPGALIAFRHVEGPEFLITDSAGEDGIFSVHRVPEGTYLLTVRASGYAPAEQSLAVPAGHDVSGLEVALVSTRGLELTVHLASGRVPDRVHLRMLGPAGAVVLTETRFTDPSGKITLSTLPEGNGTLLLSAPGGAASQLPVTIPGEPVATTLPGAGNLRIRVPALAGTDLRAMATLSAAGQPFWTVGPGGSLQSQWQLVGGKAVVEGVPGGLWQIRVESPDGRLWTGQATTVGQGGVEISLE